MCQIGGHSFHNARNPPIWPVSPIKIGQEWRLERRKIPRLPGSLDHYSAPHYSDVIMSAMASQITGVLIVYSTVCSGVDQRKHQSSASLSTVLNGLIFPYLAKMITNIRVCVAYNDLWPWPISSRSFGLGLENRVRSVASKVPDGFFPYLVQMITGMRRCVACDDLWPWPMFSRSFDLDLENHVRSVASTVVNGFFLYLAQLITIVRGCVACYVFFRIWKFEFLKKI